MFRKIIFGIIVTLAIAGAVYWFKYTKEIRTPISEGINAIPTNAAIIIESKQARNTWKKLSQTNIMWEQLLGTHTFATLNLQAKFIDSVLETNSDVSSLLENHSLYISAHTSETNTLNFLFTYSLPNLTHQSTIETFIQKINNGHTPIYIDDDKVAIGKILLNHTDSLSFAFYNGILMMSTKQSLVQNAVRQLKSGNSLANDKNFSKVLNTAGKNVDATIYINYKMLPSILQPFTFPTQKPNSDAIADFADYSSYDITLKPNALMLSGFTQANDSAVNFLNLFNKQKPQDIELTKIIPAHTSNLLFFGISNYKAFQQDYRNYLQAIHRLQTYNQFVETTNKNYNINIENSLYHWIDNEMALVVTEPTSSDYTNNCYAVFHSNTIDEATASLNEITNIINTKNNTKIDTTSFRNHLINHIDIPNLLPQLFGWQFTKITSNYFTTIDNYIVFANTDSALQVFINDFENNKTLANDKNYQAFAENISTDANVYLYSSIARSTNIYSTLVTEEIAKEMELNSGLLKKFEAVAIQFSANNKLFFSNIYLKYNPVLKQETETLWETKLDTTISSKPYLVINHNTQAKEIAVQDDANKLYLISNTGKIIWTKQLPEKIMSDVFQVDVLKNKKLQLLFNTRSAIYMYDRNGNEMKGFPIKLKSPATNAIALVDYDNNNDYRIFVATENKHINCYKANGELVSGFMFEKATAQIYLPIQYFRTNNKDHLCAIDAEGKIYIMDRHGETRINLKEQTTKGIRNFYLDIGKDYSKSFIVSADTLGNILKLSLSGDREEMKMQDFETSPYFDYKDINNDKTKEFIFLTRNELKIFSPDKSLLFKYEFKNSVSDVLQVFVFPNGKAKIGVVSESTNELYLFNDNGSLCNGFPLKGKTAFSIGDMNNDNTINIITGSADNSIYVYQLQDL